MSSLINESLAFDRYNSVNYLHLPPWHQRGARANYTFRRFGLEIDAASFGGSSVRRGARTRSQPMQLYVLILLCACYIAANSRIRSSQRQLPRERLISLHLWWELSLNGERRFSRSTEVTSLTKGRALFANTISLPLFYQLTSLFYSTLNLIT